MKLLIAGGSGFLGTALTKSLLADGHHVSVLTRNPQRVTLPAGASALAWDGRSLGAWQTEFSGMDAVINLVGENVGQWPWTEQRKRIMRASRVEAGAALARAFEQTSRRPPVLIQASGIGYYGPSDRRDLTEQAPAGQDFFSQLACDWEASSASVEALGVRRVVLRTSLVLDSRAGILPLMALPVRFFAGGPLGNGLQGVSWIHLADHVRALRFLLENDQAVGPYNITAPQPLSNSEFIATLAQVLRRPAWLPAHAFALRLALGEMSTLLLDGQYAVPARLAGLSFKFQYETARAAFTALFSR